MTVDNVTLEILRNYFQAIVEDMARVVERTAFTTFVKETADFSTGLIAPNGEYVAYPWRLGALPFLGINMKKAIDYTPHYDPGDIVIMNDPYTTGALCTHLPDIHLMKPIFSGGEIIAYAYAFIHSSDIGGTVPASVWPRALPGGAPAPADQALPGRRAEPGHPERVRRQQPYPGHELG
jgi:N-methylhydantoinase B